MNSVPRDPTYTQHVGIRFLDKESTSLTIRGDSDSFEQESLLYVLWI